MALSNGQLQAMVGVLVLLLVAIVVNNVLAARARAKARSGGASSPASAAASGAAPVDPLLVKFARHEGSVVGEGIAIDGDRLILKQGGVFKAVPRAYAEVRGDEVVITGAVDWEKAAAEGAAWHAGHRAAPIAEVSGALTRSEDVKSPALESTKDRPA